MNDPFLLDRPAVVSFSGGRTSGLMLYRILWAFGGTLPPDVRVIFCNTGKERPETLDFVQTVSMAWGVDIVWLEYRTDSRWRFRVVSHETAARQGEPFLDLIIKKRVLPNVAMRFCTTWLKIKPSNRYARHVLGFTPQKGGYTNAVGLRYDEPQRDVRADPKSTPGECPVAPLKAARVTLAEVRDFWARSPFDLALQPHEGNCDLCFLKGQGKLLRVMRDRPDLAAWWVEQERRFVGKTRRPEAARFRKAAPSYAATLQTAQERTLFDLPLTGADDLSECRCTD
jgi:3'-phosphoadenosine 5'-phosphosulfate sulfotransferase (PAPS reductase)/FAD synthetase